MGVFSCPLRISSLDNRRSREIEATIDTAATYTMLPIDVLNELGISPTRKGIFEMADGHREELDIGELRITINGASAVSPVIFGTEEVAPLLGAVTLEILLLAVDPVGQRLAPTHALLY